MQRVLRGVDAQPKEVDDHRQRRFVVPMWIILGRKRGDDVRKRERCRLSGRACVLTRDDGIRMPRDGRLRGVDCFRQRHACGQKGVDRRRQRVDRIRMGGDRTRQRSNRCRSEMRCSRRRIDCSRRRRASIRQRNDRRRQRRQRRRQGRHRIRRVRHRVRQRRDRSRRCLEHVRRRLNHIRMGRDCIRSSVQGDPAPSSAHPSVLQSYPVGS